MPSGRFSGSINIRNKQAGFDYEFIDKYVAGLVLKGTEIKSIREGQVTLQDGFVYFNNENAFVKGIRINPFAEGTHFNHEAARDRKLLLKKSELKRLKARMEEKGLAIVPVRLFISERGYAKLEIALARGKKQFDKRSTIKERDVKRDLARIKF